MKKIRFSFLVSSIAAIFFITGCAQKSTQNLPLNCKTLEDCAKIAQQKDQQLNETKSELSQKDQEIAKLKEELQSKESLLESQKKSTKNTNNVLKLPSYGLVLPPDAKPGQCFAKVVLPPQYKIEKEKVLVDEGGEKIRVIPAKYKTVEKRILVKEASEKIVPTPPVYKTVTERVLVKPETEKVIVVKPAVYKTVKEKVLVEPEHTKWVRGSLLHSKKKNLEVLDKNFNPSVGDVMCLVKVPAKYKIVTKKVMAEPPVTKTVKVPAVYKTVTKRVLVKPAGTKTIKIPAVYKTVKVRELVEPEKVEKITIPPKYKWVSKRVKVKDVVYKIEPVVCKTNLTPNLVVTLQKKLKSLGYYKGPIDGIYGPLTAQAVDAYQKDNGFARGALTLETLKALDIEVK